MSTRAHATARRAARLQGIKVESQLSSNRWRHGTNALSNTWEDASPACHARYTAQLAACKPHTAYLLYLRLVCMRHESLKERQWNFNSVSRRGNATPATPAAHAAGASASVLALLRFATTYGRDIHEAKGRSKQLVVQCTANTDMVTDQPRQ